MKIDIGHIQGMLDLYRSALDNKIPIHPSLQGHFKDNRVLLLDGFRKHAAAQRLVLRSFIAENDDESAQLQEALRIVDEFGEWADQELKIQP